MERIRESNAAAGRLTTWRSVTHPGNLQFDQSLVIHFAYVILSKTVFLQQQEKSFMPGTPL